MAHQKVPCKTNCTGNTISIEWQRKPEQIEQINKYIVKYRAKDSRVAFAVERTSESKIQMSNLASETFYVIKIYVEDLNGDESELFNTEVRTLSSTASKLLKSAERICNGYDVFRLSPVKITNLSEGIQIREFYVNSKDEKSILLLGASGSGKSILVDAIINHVTDVSFADNFRFQITDKKKQEKEDIVCYKLRSQDGINVGFNLNIIDVPGFASRYNEIQSIYQKLLALFQSVHYISAASLVVQSFCRPTEEQRCIFNNILSIFGKDIKYIIPLITFDDGGEIKALSSLQDVEVPFEKQMTFRFNNSQLFNGKEQLEIWTGRQKTMQNLFEKLRDFIGCSVEKTREVLETRIILEQSSEDTKTLKQMVEQRENKLEENRMRKSSMAQHVKQNDKQSKNERETSKNRPTMKGQTDCKNKDADETLLKEKRALTHGLMAIYEKS
ncbi:unnamed protein product [Mytilus coruscus]|uniref:Fibronectin type-III domain-containing protein n=1 Tax=Mytilus coruscus TaxID=42192 RepID=A0A6J8CQR3_MYTCO|nr:unnamed protein product [Mytilus coruscus]